MLRDYIRFVLELAYTAETLPEALECLRALSFSCTSLTRLIRTHKVLFGVTDEIMEAIAQAGLRLEAEKEIQ